MQAAGLPRAVDPQQAVGPPSASEAPPPDGVTAAGAPAVEARLYGEPLLELPADLYIPPDALRLLLDAFEGPLDLLLYLIRRQNFDILDIPMAQVTRQYLAYVERIRAANFELAAEYLLMAAVLIDIKSRLLLPRPPRAPDAEPEDPRAELARRLIEYERFRAAAQAIDALPQAGRDVWPVQVHHEPPAPLRLAAVSADEVRRAWQEVLARARLTAHHPIAREALSVRAHMTAVLRTLRGRPFAEFGELFDARQGVSHVVVTFVALLELAREALVDITQAAPFAPIYVRLAP